MKPKTTDHHHTDRVKYNPLTGIFTYGGSVLNPIYTGKHTPVIAVPGKSRLRFSAARFAWALHNKKLPPEDHYVLFRDGDNHNLAIDNLACVPKAAARQRQKTPIHNSSGHRNVSWVPTLGKWRVKINCKGQAHYIGVFEHISYAAAAAGKARRELHGGFASTE